MGYKAFDLHCEHCGHEWSDLIWHHHNIEDLPPCPECASNFVVKLPGGLKNYKAKDPYDYLDKGPEYGKKIFSGPKVSSK